MKKIYWSTKAGRINLADGVPIDNFDPDTRYWLNLGLMLDDRTEWDKKNNTHWWWIYK